MTLYEPLRDAFNEMNRMMIDRQTWQAEHERRTEQDQVQRQQADRREKRLQMQDEITAVKVAKARQQLTPRNFSIYELGDSDRIKTTMEDPKAQRLMERAVDDQGVGYRFSAADGGFIAPNGSRLQMSPLQAQNRTMAFYGIIDMHQKAPEEIQLNLIDLQGQKAQLIKDRLSENSSRAMPAKLGEIDTKLSAINADILQHQSFLDPQSGKMLRYYTNKSDRFRKRAAWAASIGAQELASEFGRESASQASMAQLAFKAMIDKPTKTGTKRVQWFAEEDGVIGPGGKEFKKNESFVEYIPVGAEGAMTRENFSTSKVDKNSGSIGGLTPPQRLSHNRAVKDSGLKIIEKIFLTSGTLIPKTEKNVKIYRAVERKYAKEIRIAAKGVVLEVGQGDELAAQIADQMVATHVEAYGIIQTLKTDKTISAVDRKLMQADLEFYRKQLGYSPSWNLRLGTARN